MSNGLPISEEHDRVLRGLVSSTGKPLSFWYRKLEASGAQRRSFLSALDYLRDALGVAHHDAAAIAWSFFNPSLVPADLLKEARSASSVVAEHTPSEPSPPEGVAAAPRGARRSPARAGAKAKPAAPKPLARPAAKARPAPGKKSTPAKQTASARKPLAAKRAVKRAAGKRAASSRSAALRKARPASRARGKKSSGRGR